MEDIFFDTWNIQKKQIHNKTKEYYFKEGEIWWIGMGINIGSEVYGKGKYFARPVLIVKKLSRYMCIIVPLSSKLKEGSWYYVLSIKGKQGSAMLHQIKMIHTNRFIDKIGALPSIIFINIKKRLSELLNLS